MHWPEESSNVTHCQHCEGDGGPTPLATFFSGKYFKLATTQNPLDHRLRRETMAKFH
jgi:hypothetical protein